LISDFHFVSFAVLYNYDQLLIKFVFFFLAEMAESFSFDLRKYLFFQCDTRGVSVKQEVFFCHKSINA